jgi:recombination protein RecT
MNTNKSIQVKRDIRSLLQSEEVKSQLEMLLPKHLTPERMVRVACTTVMKNPRLSECKPESLLQALMFCGQIGLEPDGHNLHLIPFGDQVQVIIDWKGLVALAHRNGITNIYADVVCENDEFEWYRDSIGLQFKHRVNFREERGAMYAAYAIWKDNNLIDGECMSKSEIEEVRRTSKSPNSDAWTKHYREMAKKTVIRRASKRWGIGSMNESVLLDDFPNYSMENKPEFRQPAPFPKIEGQPKETEPENPKPKRVRPKIEKLPETEKDDEQPGSFSEEEKDVENPENLFEE